VVVARLDELVADAKSTSERRGAIRVESLAQPPVEVDDAMGPL
jgi:hypothetical protein